MARTASPLQRLTSLFPDKGLTATGRQKALNRPTLLVKIFWKSRVEQVCTFLCLNGLYSHLIFIRFETEMFSLDTRSL